MPAPPAAAPPLAPPPSAPVPPTAWLELPPLASPGRGELDSQALASTANDSNDGANALPRCLMSYGYDKAAP
jgi:hypothetical protein